MGKNGSAQNMDCLTMGNWNTILLLWQKCSFVTYLLEKKKEVQRHRFDKLPEDNHI